MIEIVCPSCQARYQLPDGAIGPEGRKVSCSSCSHKWRAHPEVSEPPAAEPAPAEPAPSREEAMAAVSHAVAAAGPSGADSAPPPPPGSANRDEQMAAIRRMLSDLKEAADSTPEPGPETRKAPQAAAPSGPSARRRGDDDKPGRDHLDEHIEDVDKLAKLVKGEPTASGYDAAKLRKRHEKRAKRLQKARERRRKSGAFLTGFTLVATVSAVMVGLYVMHPQIIASQPQMAPALTEYVQTVDQYRIELDATTAQWRSWLTERIGNLTGGEEGQPQQQQ